MAKALPFLLLPLLLLAACSVTGDSATRRAHELLKAARFGESRTLIDTSLKETPDTPFLRQERMPLALLLGQPEVATAKARPPPSPPHPILKFHVIRVTFNFWSGFSEEAREFANF